MADQRELKAALVDIYENFQAIYRAQSEQQIALRALTQALTELEPRFASAYQKYMSDQQARQMRTAEKERASLLQQSIEVLRK